MTQQFASPAVESERCVATVYFMLADGSNLFDLNATSARSKLAKLPALSGPEIVRQHPEKISTYEAMSAPDELLKHYREIISIAHDNGVPFDQYCHNFWIRLEIGKDDESPAITFDWWDHLAEMERFENWIEEGAPYNFIDADQHWEINAERKGNSVEIVQRDPDRNLEVNRMIFKLSALRFALSETLDSARSLIAHLAQGVGEDVWTDYSHAQVMMGHRNEAKFGTDIWQP